MLTTPFLLRLRSYRRFSRMYNTRVRFACPIYFSQDQSSSKLIIFLDSKLERSNSRVAKIDSRLDSRNFRGLRIESRVKFRNSRVTVNLPLSGTVQHQKLSKTLSKQLFDRWTESCAWLLIQKSTNSLLNNDNSPSHSTRGCRGEGLNHMENGSALLAGWSVDQAAECIRWCNAKIGHTLFHSLFQHDDIVGRSLYETSPTKKHSLMVLSFLITTSMVDFWGVKESW